MQSTGGVLLGAAAIACAFSFAVVKLTAPESEPAPGGETAAAPAVFGELRDGHEQLSASVRGLSRRLDALEARRAPVAAAASDEQVRRAVRELLAESGQDDLRKLADDASARPQPIDFEGAIAKVGDPSLDWDARQAVWAQISEAGLTDKVVAAIEEYADAHPNDADAQTGKGTAYLQKLWIEKNDIAKGALATKADAAFDRALQLDPNQWDARFLKATSLSFWPPVMGKQPDAVKHFEILLQQQEASGAKRGGYDQTYLFLGNLYAQQGKTEKAREMWQRGLNLFPDNGELRGKLKD